METLPKTLLKLFLDFFGLVGTIFIILFSFAFLLALGSTTSSPGEFVKFVIDNYWLLIIAVVATIYFVWLRENKVWFKNHKKLS